MVKHDGYRRWVLGAALAATMAYVLSTAGLASPCGCGAACGCRLPQRSMAAEAAGPGACCLAAGRANWPRGTALPEASLLPPGCCCQLADGSSESAPPCQCRASGTEVPVAPPRTPAGGEHTLIAPLSPVVHVALPPSAATSDPAQIARGLPRVNLQQWLCVWRD